MAKTRPEDIPEDLWQALLRKRGARGVALKSTFCRLILQGELPPPLAEEAPKPEEPEEVAILEEPPRSDAAPLESS